VYSGRKPNTKRLGLEKVGVELDSHGAIKVRISATLGSAVYIYSFAASLSVECRGARVKPVY
jgi:pyruvate/2-oxoglutarate dehydrogenase complex dihydrolipoamide dehydrogenase (E3) component